jgi:hypothetical protein
VVSKNRLFKYKFLFSGGGVSIDLLAGVRQFCDYYSSDSAQADDAEVFTPGNQLVRRGSDQDSPLAVSALRL